MCVCLQDTPGRVVPTLTSATTGVLIWDLKETAEADLRLLEEEFGMTKAKFHKELKKLPVSKQAVSGGRSAGWKDDKKRWPNTGMFLYDEVTIIS